MKKLTLLSLVLAVVFMALLTGCTSGGSDGVVGTYICTEGCYVDGQPVEAELQLSKDGTFFVNAPGQPTFSGEWKVNGDELRLTYESSGASFTAKIGENTLTMDDGSILIKKN